MPEEQAKPASGNSWSKWQEYILHELRRLSTALEDIQQWALEMRLQQIRPEDWLGLKEEVKKHDERLDKLERTAWVIMGVCAFLSPVVIWAIIEIIKSLLNK